MKSSSSAQASAPMPSRSDRSRAYDVNAAGALACGSELGVKAWDVRRDDGWQDEINSLSRCPRRARSSGSLVRSRRFPAASSSWSGSTAPDQKRYCFASAGRRRELSSCAVFIMIGAKPTTAWLSDMVELDTNRRSKVAHLDGSAHRFQATASSISSSAVEDRGATSFLRVPEAGYEYGPRRLKAILLAACLLRRCPIP